MGITTNVENNALLHREVHHFRHRVLDITAVVVMVVVLLPLLIVVAAFTLCCNGARIFKKVSRVTRAVAVLNFRLKRSASNAQRLANGHSRFLARSRLVALPELFNVLSGELSFFDPTGARPALFAG